ncbi:MAG: hypothetical protein IPP07_26340 [Holophagales bacterium]|nr:hypothetical protein [Holophagales bacterium]
MLPLGRDDVTGTERPSVQKKRHLRNGNTRNGRHLGTDRAAEDGLVLEGLSRLGEGCPEGWTVFHEPRDARLSF